MKDAEHFTGFKLYDVCKITTARWPQSQTGLNAAFFTQKYYKTQKLFYRQTKQEKANGKKLEDTHKV